MGKYKFRFSDMMPNAWFHKLKDMSNIKPKSKSITINTNNNNPSISSHLNSHQRKSYYFSRDLSLQPEIVAEPPRKSSRRRRSSNRIRPPRHVSTSVSAGCSCRATADSVSPPSPEPSAPDHSSSSGPDSVLTEYGSGSGADSMASWSSPCKCGDDKNDIIIDIDNSAAAAAAAGEDHCPRLAPIITKPAKVMNAVEEGFVSPARRIPAKATSASPGMRLRVNSPRIANRRIQGRRSVSRRSIGDSFAVVKASKDPRRDFRESMVEMIMENKIKASKDLEELLACYLSLNSDEYHDLIISVFKQIWFDFIHVRLN